MARDVDRSTAQPSFKLGWGTRSTEHPIHHAQATTHAGLEAPLPAMLSASSPQAGAARAKVLREAVAGLLYDPEEWDEHGWTEPRGQLTSEDVTIRRTRSAGQRKGVASCQGRDAAILCPAPLHHPRSRQETPRDERECGPLGGAYGHVARYCASLLHVLRPVCGLAMARRRRRLTRHGP